MFVENKKEDTEQYSFSADLEDKSRLILVQMRAASGLSF